MPPNDQTTHFANDLERLINRYRDEYDLSYAQMIGAMYFTLHLLCREAEQKIDDEEDGLQA